MKIFIGFDQKNKNIKILKADKSSEVELFTMRYQSKLFTDRFISEFQTLLSEFVNANNIPKNTSAYIVMPDNTVSFETFDLPSMNKVKLQKALDTELTNEYGAAIKDKKISKFLITSSKQFSTFGVMLFDKKTILQLNKAISEAKLFPRGATYDGNAVVNSILHVMPRSHGKSFVVADIRDGSTEIAVCSRGKTMGVASLPYGLDLIKKQEVCDEYLITDHTAAEIAVINAREVAKAKALTTSGEDEEEPVIETVAAEVPQEKPQAEVAAEAAEEAAADSETPAEEQNTEKTTETTTENTTENPVENTTENTAESTEDTAEDDDFDEEEIAAEAVAQEAVVADETTVADPVLPYPNAPKAKVYRKTKRRLPKFMQREVPEEEEKIAYENFRIILKWVLLYARQAKMTAYVSDPDFVIVKLPEDMHYLIDMANEEQGENQINLRPVKGLEKQSAVITENLDLYGTSFIGLYNRNQNFFKIGLGLLKGG